MEIERELSKHVAFGDLKPGQVFRPLHAQTYLLGDQFPLCIKTTKNHNCATDVVNLADGSVLAFYTHESVVPVKAKVVCGE